MCIEVDDVILPPDLGWVAAATLVGHVLQGLLYILSVNYVTCSVALGFK